MSILGILLPHLSNIQGFLLKLILVFFIFFSLYADEIDNKYSLRAAYGTASENDLGEILSGDFGSHSRDLSAYSLEGGYLLKKEIFDWPLDIYVKGGLSYFDEDQFDDMLEVVVSMKAYLNLDFWGNRVRIGAAEGLSYASSVPESEAIESQEEGDNSSKFLNYLDISLDFDLGKLIRYKPMYETYVGYALKHRSGVFGVFNGVHGGSNYNMLYLEKNF